MIVGIGTDIVEINRVRHAIENEHFIERVYTLKERDYCESRGRQKAASYAVRFAGKEAFFKALGTGIICDLTCVEIINDELGCPRVNLNGKVSELLNRQNMATVHISLSHSREYATAVCVIETK